MIILGIDPGTLTTGYAVLSDTARSISVIDCGALALKRRTDLPQRLSQLYDRIGELIMQHKIDYISLETPFLGKNASSYLKLGYVRALVYLLSQQRSVRLVEYAPRTVKKAITSWGGAPKDQVARMLYRLFPSLPPGLGADATDALSIALTAMWRKCET